MNSSELSTTELSPPALPILDSHMHLFRGGYASTYGAAFAHRNEVALYESLRMVHKIERALVVGFEGGARFEGNNRDLATWSQEHDWMVPLEFCDLNKPPQFSYFATSQSNAFAGISLYVGTPKEGQMLSTWPSAVIDTLNANRAIVSLNITPNVLRLLGDWFARLGGCSVLISHLGSPGVFRTAPPQDEVLRRLEPLRRLSSLPHVGVKVSGLYAMSDPSHDYPHCSSYPFLNLLREDFGTGGLYWGSDFSPALKHVSFSQTVSVLSHLNWPREEVESIMGTNLKQLLDQRNRSHQ